ncbi:flagellin FliC, partial [Citrobacter sp. HN-141]|nr:flagellin FliC [Citrobacter sp. HN-141]MDW2656255.1 flagellin FliC [Citrobacter sp. HN-120]MDW2699281.1 flagellin FliC [Citrobacter sp. HN-144]
GTNSQSDLDSIQAEITQRLNEIDRVSGQTQFNGVKVLAKDNTLTIQVGANDGETIDINLKEINSKTLGLDSLNVQQKYKVSDTAVAPVGYQNSTVAPVTTGFSASAVTAIKNKDSASTATGATITGDVKFDEAKNKYYANVTVAGDTAKNGVYEVEIDDTSGAVTLKD